MARAGADQRGADLVVLPELWSHGGYSYPTWAERAEPVDGPSMSAIAEGRGVTLGAVVHAGSIVERGPEGGPRGAQGRGRWNTSVLFGPAGERMAVYRKIHRFGFGNGEPALLEAGDELVVRPGSTSAARPPASGSPPATTCASPSSSAGSLDDGAELVLIPAAWPAPGSSLDLLGRARAIEDQVVVVQCNTGGTHAGVPMGGHSQVVDATGRVLAEAGDGEEVLVVDVDLGRGRGLARALPRSRGPAAVSADPHRRRPRAALASPTGARPPSATSTPSSRCRGSAGCSSRPTATRLVTGGRDPRRRARPLRPALWEVDPAGRPARARG